MIDAAAEFTGADISQQNASFEQENDKVKLASLNRFYKKYFYDRYSNPRNKKLNLYYLLSIFS